MAKPATMAPITWSNVQVTLGDLKPWERNPKTISKAHAKRLLELWERLGQFQTIAIGPGGEVYDGHRGRIAKSTSRCSEGCLEIWPLAS